MKNFTGILVFLITATHLFGQSGQYFSGPSGIYIKTWKEFPRRFVYQVDLKDSKGEWQRIQQLKYPVDETEFRSRIMEAAALLPHLSYPAEMEISHAWKMAEKGMTIDSLYVDAANPLYYYALGLGTILKLPGTSKTIEIRVLKREGPYGKTIQELLYTIPPEVKPLKTKIHSSAVKPQGNSIVLEFEIKEFDRMQDCKVFRGHLFRKDFREIKVPRLYSKKEGKMIITILDDDVIDNMAYSYFVVPFDLMGTFGKSSDTVNINSTAPKSLKTFFRDFKVKSLDEQDGIQITWKVSSEKDLISIDVYRSDKYDGEYRLIGSVDPGTTEYIDYDVEPVKGYYYQCQFNGNYIQSLPTPRIPAMLHANKPNLFPPSGPSAVLSGNIVTLTWNRQDQDNHGYYVYRSNGMQGELILLSGLITTPDNTVNYRDTLKPCDSTRTFSYAVADVNTSYAISKPSERINIQVPAGLLPVPEGLNARYTDPMVLLIWDNVFDKYDYITGYHIYRSALDAKGREIEKEKLITKNPTGYGINYFKDSTIQEGIKYFYSLEAVGLSPDIKSSKCLPAAVIVPALLPLPPSNVKIFGTENQILLTWDNPVGEEIDHILIRRLNEDKSLTEFKTTDKETSEFIDNEIKKGAAYFYQLISVDKKGRLSKATDPLGTTAG